MEAIYDAKAYKQAYVISNFLIDTGEIVMTQKLLDTLEARMDKDYYFDMNDINNIELLPDTEKILTQIYLECLAPAKEKEKMKLYSLDNYCIFIASKYVNSLEDHINLVKVSKRMRGNMEKFHFNPISLNPLILKYFPNVETLHLYDERDKDGFGYGGRLVVQTEGRGGACNEVGYTRKQRGCR